MELHSIDTLSEGWDDDPRVMVVFVAVKGRFDPQEVMKFAAACLEPWGEEPTAISIYSLQPDDKRIEGYVIIGISCEV